MMQPFINDGRDEQSIIMHRIMQYSQYIWENRIHGNNVEMWVGNFKGIFLSQDTEKKVALVLLSEFLYYNEGEIKYLCRNLYSLFKQKIIGGYLHRNPSAHLSDAEDYFNYYLKLCGFSDMGEPSESSGYILYLFRQENNLSINLFKHKNEISIAIKQKEIKALVVIDDFLGSGDTAVRFWDDPSIQELRESDSTIDFYYLVLLAMEHGIRNVQDKTDFCVIPAQIFSEKYRVFSDKSIILPEDMRPDAEDICKRYGEKLEGEMYALGYNNSQALIGMHHNIPNNTLPIIWSENNWHPIFPRKSKIYRRDG